MTTNAVPPEGPSEAQSRDKSLFDKQTVLYLIMSISMCGALVAFGNWLYQLGYNEEASNNVLGLLLFCSPIPIGGLPLVGLLLAARNASRFMGPLSKHGRTQSILGLALSILGLALIVGASLWCLRGWWEIFAALWV